MWNDFLFSVNATLPVFGVMALGFLLRRGGFLTHGFCQVANKLVFHLCLPAMLFRQIAAIRGGSLPDGAFLLYAFCFTLASTFAVWGFSRICLRDKTQVGAFAQGAFRGNTALLGSVLLQSICGSQTYAPLIILAAVPLYNVLSVIILSLEAGGGGKLDAARMKSVLLNVVKNPILIGIFLGAPFAVLQIHIPAMVEKSLSMLSNLATPLSLLVIGAAFVWGDAMKKARPTLLAASIKLLILPALFLPAAVALGFRDAQLMAILIMLGSPSTPSGYIMAKQMGNDHVLANGIVVLTTLLAAVTITLWIFLLRTFGWL